MFLDIHAHSAAQSIFIYAPASESEAEQSYIVKFPQILANSSEFFLWENCKFSNEKSKRNCARLAFYRDWSILDTYTIESSCFGYKVKGSGEEEGEQP